MDGLNMEAQATEGMVIGLVSRLERDGHYLTPSAVAKIHQLITDCIPDRRTEGTQKELSAFVRDRMDRDQ
jgi:hypothetical protein